MTVRAARALSRTCCPTVWLWTGQALYAGAALDLAPHSGSVWCLAVGVDGGFTVRAGKGEPVTARSALIPPRTVHHLVAAGGRMIFCYLDPASDRAAACLDRMREPGVIAIGHREQATLAALGEQLLEAGSVAWDAPETVAAVRDPGRTADERNDLLTVDPDSLAARWLDLAAPSSARRIDDRISTAAQWIRSDPARAVSAADIAARVHLSESRFLHLFRQELGTSLRRYRVWVRLLHAATLLDAGANLTTAAAESGFATPSHLAHRFRATFGLPAGQFLGTGVRLRISPDQ